MTNNQYFCQFSLNFFDCLYTILRKVMKTCNEDDPRSYFREKVIFHLNFGLGCFPWYMNDVTLKYNDNSPVHNVL